MGSLVTAVASYCDAKSHQGSWYLRIDDIDPPREQPGAASAIVESLLQHGFQWDGDVLYQSQRHGSYQHAFDTLIRNSRVYGCQCTRKMLADTTVYPGTCRQAGLPLTGNACRCLNAVDTKNSEPAADDVIIRRRDGLFSYTLCTVVDDISDRITHVVRGMDLHHAETAQTQLFHQLGETPPEWRYTELVKNDQHQKLSKQNLAPPLDNAIALQNLTTAWRLLKQASIGSVSSIAEFWRRAHSAWAPLTGFTQPDVNSLHT